MQHAFIIRFCLAHEILSTITSILVVLFARQHWHCHVWDVALRETLLCRRKPTMKGTGRNQRMKKKSGTLAGDAKNIQV